MPGPAWGEDYLRRDSLILALFICKGYISLHVTAAIFMLYIYFFYGYVLHECGFVLVFVRAALR